VVGRGRRGLPGTVAGRRAAIAAVLLTLAVLLLAPTGRGITVEDRTVGPDGGLPLRVYVPQGTAAGSGPGVVVAHGFAGSAALMHTWSLALAHAGFVVVAPDLPGHGANLASLADRPDRLPEAVTAALAELRAMPEVDAGRVALLGHSMGSGAVLAVGVERPELVRAVVAVSPTDAPVTSSAPRDLLLLAGANEARFVANAESLLDRAGGARGVAGDGDARELVIVPVVEHVSILFSRTAHERSIAWLSGALDHAPTGTAPTGPLAGWVLLVLAIVMLWQALVAQAATPAREPGLRSVPWLALPVGGVAATASLVIIVRSVDLPQLTGLLVAGEVGLWFLMAGAVWLRFGIRPAAPEARDLGWLVLAVAVLLGVGASTTLAWAPWWLGGVRVTNAALLAVMLLPFSVALSSLLHGRRGRAAVGAWLSTSMAVVVTLGAAAVVVPGIGFLILVLPLLPLVLATTTAVAVGVDRPWASGPATAVFVGWLLAMLFPLG
jgi:pimeloyl-ACP methyl ester carboxylesterase